MATNEIVRSEVIEALKEKLRLNFGCEPREAEPIQVFKACALVMRDIMAARLVDADNRTEKTEAKQVHYLSLEFLLGRSLEKNAYNLGMLDIIEDALRDLGFDPAEFFEIETDAALGNGGLGRLAACYLEAMTTRGLPATGYSLLYEYGLFRQKFIANEQQELPDKWLDVDDVWLIRNYADSYTVRFGGTVEYKWSGDKMTPVYHDASEIIASPSDMLISGYATDTVNRLRLWSARVEDDMDMGLFTQGQYLQAVQKRAMAEVLTKCLYPSDDHFEGKMLRLRQQYFFVSATVQDIVKKHLEQYGTLSNFHKKHVLQINDTHPTLAIPELMRIFLDEHGYDWDRAWHIVSQSVCYTNHTVLPEALECWPQNIMQMLIPRIYDIIAEIHRRFDLDIEARFGGDPAKKSALSILYGGQVRMANLCIAGCHKINGVSALHTDILKNNVFADANRMFPGKIENVTNGIDHRRWLGQANPRLASLIDELIGENWKTDASLFSGLMKYTDDKQVLRRLAEIKHANKVQMADIIKRNCGVTVDPDSMFDVQAKRLHEYKRQLMNVMHILYLYLKIKDGNAGDLQPRTFIFGAKAASGYYVAKRIIKMINDVAQMINSDPDASRYIRVAFLENYNVSLAERLMPASELSEQISLAGKEASGTGNMKFMMNGALTIGTMDGANVEMCELAGRENMFIFGMSADEAAQLAAGGYNPIAMYESNAMLKRVVDFMRSGFVAGEGYADIVHSLLNDDTYRLFADLPSYTAAHQLAEQAYRDPERWNRMSLINIAKSGHFAADRSIAEYANKIWHV